MSDALLPDLEDEAYWENPSSEMHRVLRARMDAGLLGLVIGAPSRMPLEGRATLPIWGCFVEPLGAWGRPLEELAVVVAANLDTGKVYAAPAFPPPAFVDDLPPPSPTPPPKGFSGNLLNLDGFEQLDDLPRRPAAYAFSVIIQSSRSNLARVELYGASGVASDPEVQRFIEAERRRKGPPEPWPLGAGRAPGRLGDEAPPVPPDFGIELRVPRVHVLHERASCMLTGSYRLPVPGHYVAVARKPDQPEAIVPITLVMTRDDSRVPIVSRLRISCWTPVETTDGKPVASGQFALDLMSLPDLPHEPRTRHVFAYSGAVASQPATVSLVPPEMLED